MKIQVCFKTPDAIEYATSYVLTGLHGEEKDNLQAEIQSTTDKFVEYGEQVVIEFDTETQTATVVPITRK